MTSLIGLFGIAVLNGCVVITLAIGTTASSRSTIFYAPIVIGMCGTRAIISDVFG